MINVNHLTNAFTPDKGIFDVSFNVKEGEVFGYLGPNGAGKSTTIRHLLGFMRPQEGSASITGMDCWHQAADIQKNVGYLPGEIAFIEGMKGDEFIQLIEGMRKIKHQQRRDELIERFQFDVHTPIHKMSKGMKQKVGLVTAFMHDPKVLILDEPTSGLDPLMQKVFIDLISEEKARGKTILMSSHSFTEIERTSDRVGIIKEGRMVTVKDIHHLRSEQRKVFEVTVRSQEDINTILSSNLDARLTSDDTVQIEIQGNYPLFIDTLHHCDVSNISIHEQELEDLFMNYYDRKEAFQS
ncbi:ABC transporter ATP-binding protein [Tuberibacillus sp. Marseille-P3662]|uniref:ABC transporter ATP-binding protein n=1 Tax=Tuberibacillus sp. Marseille-P3662 TaxID=1965358 RepID=UPI000A1CDEED|nr:ABC transporter ATP-binding protein [Tuberibacillus sp. Marseille-P3662]